jgi:hypothetical protein
LTAADCWTTKDGKDDGDDDLTAMAKELEKLRGQLEAVRREAFEEGYAAGYAGGYAAALDVLRQHKPTAIAAGPIDATRDTFSAARREPTDVMPRGMTAVIVEDILKSVAPRALTPKQIHDLSKERGNVVNQNSIPRTLRRLADQDRVEQFGETTAWKYKTKPRLVGT